MTPSIGSIGRIGTPGISNTPIEQTDPAADDAEPGDDGPSNAGSAVLDMAAQALSMAGLLQRNVHAPTLRVAGDGPPIRRIDRRRKRSV